MSEMANAIPPTLAHDLTQGLKELKIVLSPDIQQTLLRFIQLLTKWNQTYNLTAVRDPRQMIARHILDSLAILPFVRGPRVLDIGTGAGLPGVPLALAQPEWRFVLLDANAKKTRFVTHAGGELGIKNIEAVQARIEKYRAPEPFDTMVARAVASLGELVASTSELFASGAQLLAMKGAYPEEELTALPESFKIQGVHRLQVPGLDAARHLVIITRR